MKKAHILMSVYLLMVMSALALLSVAKGMSHLITVSGRIVNDSDSITFTSKIYTEHSELTWYTTANNKSVEDTYYNTECKLADTKDERDKYCKIYKAGRTWRIILIVCIFLICVVILSMMRYEKCYPLISIICTLIGLALVGGYIASDIELHKNDCLLVEQITGKIPDSFGDVDEETHCWGNSNSDYTVETEISLIFMLTAGILLSLVGLSFWFAVRRILYFRNFIGSGRIVDTTKRDPYDMKQDQTAQEIIKMTDKMGKLNPNHPDDPYNHWNVKDSGDASVVDINVESEIDSEVDSEDMWYWRRRSASN